MVMHKDSMFYTQWKNFKDNNPIMTRAFEWKMYYDESDNIFIRSFRSITDKISEGLRMLVHLRINSLVSCA
jgi:import inner membrane translocase subunit TIM44